MHAKEAPAFALICLLLAHEHNAEHATQSAAMRVPKEHAIALNWTLTAGEGADLHAAAALMAGKRAELHAAAAAALVAGEGAELDAQCRRRS